MPACNSGDRLDLPAEGLRRGDVSRQSGQAAATFDFAAHSLLFPEVLLRKVPFCRANIVVKHRALLFS